MTVHFDCTILQTNKQTNSQQLIERKRRRPVKWLYTLTKWQLILANNSHKQANKQPTTQTKKARWQHNMTVHFDKVKWSLRPANNSLKQTNKQTNSSQLRKKKKKTTVRCDCTLLQSDDWYLPTNKQTAHNSRKRRRLIKWPFTLTVHFDKVMLYTFDCTDRTLLTLETKRVNEPKRSKN